jgi:hypothetical protein
MLKFIEYRNGKTDHVDMFNLVTWNKVLTN